MGLRAALDAFAQGLALPTTITAPERLSPAVVEVAVYRIAVEALLNTARHAQATAATVVVRVDHSIVVVDIDDDGVGVAAGSTPGVGTLSMRERAAELGGSLTLSTSPAADCAFTRSCRWAQGWPMTTRVAIVDDHRVFREGLAALLTGRDGIEVIADFADAETLYEALPTLDVDVLLLDVHLPGDSGLAALSRIGLEAPTVRVLVLTMHDDATTVRAAIDAGADGYLVKTSGLDDIARAVVAVAAGQFVMGAGTERARAPLPRRDPRAVFTDRELQVLDLLAVGATTAQISLRLGISGKTVRNYLSTLYAKLGVEDRGQAALAAQRLRGA